MQSQPPAQHGNRVWALGGRGETPVQFRIPAGATPADIQMWSDIPGVRRAPGGLATTWDMAPFLAELLDTTCPQVPLSDSAEVIAAVRALPGFERYSQRDYRSKLRDYQKSGAAFMALRSYAINADPCRSGKTAQTIAAADLTGADHILVVCPSMVKLVWAAEIAKWTGEEAVVLEGLDGSSARQFCNTCYGKGYVEDTTHCEACRLLNGQSHGLRILRLDDPRRDLHSTIAKSRWNIINYELIVPQQSSDGAGGKFVHPTLAGWNPHLAQHKFDLAVADEGHYLRGRNTSKAKINLTRRERFNALVDRVPQVWGLTATPIYSYVRDLWGLIDAISRGAVTGPDRLFFKFDTRYCLGQQGEYGWENTGESPLARTELAARMHTFKIQRPRSLILSYMPPKIREVHRLDRDTKASAAAARGAAALAKASEEGAKSKLSKLINQTSAIKRPYVIDNVLTDMANGDKTIVFCLQRAPATALAKELAKKMTSSKEHSARLRAENARVWLAHGDTNPKNRLAMCEAFREHEGAAVFVTTMDAVQIGVSLKGASSVHFMDLHWAPAAMIQAEDRPYEPGITGLTIVYYVVKGSIDEHIEASVLPRFRAQDAIVGEEGARDVSLAFAGPAEVMKEVIARLTKHLEEEQAEDDEFAALIAD